jgi:hypothetical protein
MYSRCCFAFIVTVPKSQSQPLENSIVSLRIVAGLVFLAACSSATQRNSASGGQLTGGATPQLAVESFMRAIRAKDLQAMGASFGTSNGAARDNMDRTELEKREIILACYFAHDSYRVLSEAAGKGDHREIHVEIKRGNLTRQSTFYAIEGPGRRWYVDNMDIAAVRDFCGNPRS